MSVFVIPFVILVVVDTAVFFLISAVEGWKEKHPQGKYEEMAA